MEGDILDTLEQLGYDGPLLEEKLLLEASERGLSSLQYVQLCTWLTSRLKLLCDLEENLQSSPDDTDSLQVEMSGLMKELNCPFEDVTSWVHKDGVRTSKDHLKLILFLSSELQAAQIVRSKQDDKKQHNKSSAQTDLDLMCDALNVKGDDAAQVLAQVQNKVEQLLKDLPGASVGEAVLKKPLTSEQWEKLLSINQALSSEYECRRRMLIKRLDVTVQSFGWSDRAKVKVDSMARVYQPRRHSLKPQSTVDMADLLAAREDICNVVKTSSGSSREKTTCAVNKVLMGRVPDRGGRPEEIQAPPPEMPPWQKRQDGGGSWGGRGRGGWRQGGGGWGQGTHQGWNNKHGDHGGHGGKRTRYHY
ncbi:protein FAM98B [Gouania willdenowi]|uniref:Protein FAM98B n=1 Tax=Gouania willdenowi TaxID=441366 RepID=A0A8C5NCZ3_GOUWI|nr:protein FAM98B [Gouania willdenowi]